MDTNSTPEPTDRPTPDPVRYELFTTTCRPFPLDELAAYVAGVSLGQRIVYVDRRAEGYTWSFVHGGGPYPLLREVAQFIDYPYTKLVLGGRAVGDRRCGLIGADNDDKPDDHVVAIGPSDDEPAEAAEEDHGDDWVLIQSTHVEPLAAEIGELLERLVRDRFSSLTIEPFDGESNRYVQFLVHDGAWLVAESVGDVYLDDPGSRPLTDRERVELVRLGWNEPDEAERGHGNYVRKWEPPNIADAAQITALTLLRVHGLDAGTLFTATTGRCSSECRE